MGRICPEKRPDLAIKIARAAGIPLKMAAKVDRADQEYFDTVIRPMLDGPGAELIGEITEAEKSDFLSGALALLMPIDWPEPFGLVMIESMACGVPVIAFNRGSVPEVVEHGLTGFIVEDPVGAIAAVSRLDTLPRASVRARFEQRFTARRMATDYLATYRELSADRGAHLRVVSAQG
jgi:glycosyltransferase involved in cell wall biosynthesis